MRLKLSRKDDPALFQAIPNHVSLFSAINPRRDRATNPRLQLAKSAARRHVRGAASLLCCRRSVSAKILREIDCGIVYLQQRLERSPFRINHVVAFKLDVEELQFVVLARLEAGDGRAVDQHLRRDQHAIDQYGVSRRNVEIGSCARWSVHRGLRSRRQRDRGGRASALGVAKVEDLARPPFARSPNDVVEPKAISPTDPAARYTGSANTVAAYAYPDSDWRFGARCGWRCSNSNWQSVSIIWPTAAPCVGASTKYEPHGFSIERAVLSVQSDCRLVGFLLRALRFRAEVHASEYFAFQL